MFDVGFAELILLSIVGLLVLGPERLPKVARTLGGLSRKARNSWSNLKRSIEAEINADELKEPLKKFKDDFQSSVNSVKSEVDSLKKSVTADPPSNDDK
jgi:sec-independent protein translocase protein TatB